LAEYPYAISYFEDFDEFIDPNIDEGLEVLVVEPYYCEDGLTQTNCLDKTAEPKQGVVIMIEFWPDVMDFKYGPFTFNDITFDASRHLDNTCSMNLC
jgi:hypothetical protein